MVGVDPRMLAGYQARHAVGIEERRVFGGREGMVGRHQRAPAAEIPDSHVAENATRGGQLRRQLARAEAVELERLLENAAGAKTAVGELIKLARVQIGEIDGDLVVGSAPAGE